MEEYREGQKHVVKLTFKDLQPKYNIRVYFNKDPSGQKAAVPLVMGRKCVLAPQDEQRLVDYLLKCCLYLYVIVHVLLYCIVFECVLMCFAYDLEEDEAGGCPSRHMSLELGICQADGTRWEALASTSCSTESNSVLVEGALHRIAIIHCWERKKGIA